MTKEECAIVTIYTGVAMLEGDDLEYLYRYVEKLMERPVFTHELATLADELKKRAKPDFINLCRWASAQPNTSNTLNALDCISRREAIDDLHGKDPSQIWDTADIEVWINELPSVQPEQAILSWLLAYHIKSFDLHGRYMPHEVIGWLVHDFANAYMAERREE